MTSNTETSSPIDLSLLKQYAHGDEDILNELIDAFYTETQKALTELNAGKDIEDSTRWTEAAHKIKGSAGYVGADTLRKLSADAQKMEGSTPAERSDVFNNIQKAYIEVENSLKEST